MATRSSDPIPIRPRWSTHAASLETGSSLPHGQRLGSPTCSSATRWPSSIPSAWIVRIWLALRPEPRWGPAVRRPDAFSFFFCIHRSNRGSANCLHLGLPVSVTYLAPHSPLASRSNGRTSLPDHGPASRDDAPRAEAVLAQGEGARWAELPAPK